MRIVQWVSVFALALLFLVKGVLPAFSQVRTDFANYYTASWVAVREPAQTARLYDQEWFSRKVNDLGEPEGGVFQPFPPATALLLTPLTVLSMKDAKAVWSILNLFILAALVVMFIRLSRTSLAASLLLLLGSGWALVNDVYLGQVYLVMLLCLTLSFYYLEKGKDVLAGIYGGLFIPIKYFPLLLVGFFLLEGRWRAAGAALTTAVAVGLLGVVVVGLDVHSEFLKSVIGSHLDGRMADPYSISYQSWNSLLRSLFVKDAALNPNPLFGWEEGFSVLRAGISVSFILLAAFTLLSGRKRRGHSGIRLAVLFVLGLLIAPATASYHYLLLALPGGLLLRELDGDTDFLPLMTLSGLYIVMGLLPVPLLARLGLDGGLIFLGYSKLFLLTITFGVLIWTSLRERHKVPGRET